MKNMIKNIYLINKLNVNIHLVNKHVFSKKNDNFGQNHSVIAQVNISTRSDANWGYTKW